MSQPATDSSPPATQEQLEIVPGSRVVVWRSTNPKALTPAMRKWAPATVLCTDGSERPVKVKFDDDDQEFWFWKADIAPILKVGDVVTVVRSRNPKEGTCVGHVGQTGTVLRTDGTGRPYQVGFGDRTLWYWPGDIFPPQAPTGQIKVRFYLVPDEQSQKELEKLGFDLRAPKSSFDPSEDKTNPRCFGGAHVTMFEGIAPLIPDCFRQLQVAANHCRRVGWALPKIECHDTRYQPTFMFDESDPHTATLQDATSLAIQLGIGWCYEKRGLHLSVYSSTLEEKPSPEACEEMKGVLERAQWGFLLVMHRVGDDKNLFFDLSTWEEISERKMGK